MIVLDFLVALVVAALLTLVFAVCFRRTGPWETASWFFLIVLLASWAGGAWVRPVGPTFWGVYWLPFVWIGLLVALLLAATSPPAPTGATPAEVREVQRESTALAAVMAVSWFLWIALVGLVLAVSASYVFAARVAPVDAPQRAAAEPSPRDRDNASATTGYICSPCLALYG